MTEKFWTDRNADQWTLEAIVREYDAYAILSRDQIIAGGETFTRNTTGYVGSSDTIYR